MKHSYMTPETAIAMCLVYVHNATALRPGQYTLRGAERNEVYVY